MESSFAGKLEEIPRIYVDNFEKPQTDGARAYFLSHYHTDHTVGLGSRILLEKLRNGKNVFIYATKMTAAIIVHNYPAYSEFVKVLDLGSNLITVPGDASNEEYYLKVIVIPAGHCIGSAMFLFETTNVKVLYTGDFRIRPNDLPKYTALHTKDGGVVQLDALYVDTTFINLEYEEFPKRSQSVEDTIHMIRKWLEDDKQYVRILTSANYGYEYVFNQIYKVLKMKVYVDETRWNFYSKIQHLVPGVTNDPGETRISLKCTIGGPKVKTIRFNARSWLNWNEEPSMKSTGDNNFTVCFSTHCSRSELISFVEYLQPVKVIGFSKPYVVGGKSVTMPALPLSPRKSPKKQPCQSSVPGRAKRKVDGALLKELLGTK